MVGAAAARTRPDRVRAERVEVRGRHAHALAHEAGEQRRSLSPASRSARSASSSSSRSPGARRAAVGALSYATTRRMRRRQQARAQRDPAAERVADDVDRPARLARDGLADRGDVLELAVDGVLAGPCRRRSRRARGGRWRARRVVVASTGATTRHVRWSAVVPWTSTSGRSAARREHGDPRAVGGRDASAWADPGTGRPSGKRSRGGAHGGQAVRRGQAVGSPAAAAASSSQTAFGSRVARSGSSRTSSPVQARAEVRRTSTRPSSRRAPRARRRAGGGAS